MDFEKKYPRSRLNPITAFLIKKKKEQCMKTQIQDSYSSSNLLHIENSKNFHQMNLGEFKWVIILFELPAELIELIDCIINTKSLYLKVDFNS